MYVWTSFTYGTLFLKSRYNVRRCLRFASSGTTGWRAHKAGKTFIGKCYLFMVARFYSTLPRSRLEKALWLRKLRLPALERLYIDHWCHLVEHFYFCVRCPYQGSYCLAKNILHRYIPARYSSMMLPDESREDVTSQSCWCPRLVYPRVEIVDEISLLFSLPNHTFLSTQSPPICIRSPQLGSLRCQVDSARSSIAAYRSV